MANNDLPLAQPPAPQQDRRNAVVWDDLLDRLDHVVDDTTLDRVLHEE